MNNYYVNVFSPSDKHAQMHAIQINLQVFHFNILTVGVWVGVCGSVSIKSQVHQKPMNLNFSKHENVYFLVYASSGRLRPTHTKRNTQGDPSVQPISHVYMISSWCLNQSNKIIIKLGLSSSALGCVRVYQCETPAS